MKTQEVSRELERFAAARNRAVGEQALKCRREMEGNPNWRPNSLEGIYLQNKARKILLGAILPAASKSRERVGLMLIRRPKSSALVPAPVKRMLELQPVDLIAPTNTSRTFAHLHSQKFFCPWQSLKMIEKPGKFAFYHFSFISLHI
jgi:hypothetical protein